MYLGGEQFMQDGEHYFGGMEYVRNDTSPDLPGLSFTARSGCQFCSAVKFALQRRQYRGSHLWHSHTNDVLIRMQYKWKADCGHSPSCVVAIVVSVLIRGKFDSLLEFPIHALNGKPLARVSFKTIFARPLT